MTQATCVVREATASDLDAIHAIEVASFSQPWRRESFRDLLLGDFARVVVAEDGGAVVGFAVLVGAAGEAELANVAVAPGARRGGAGRRLVESLVQGADRRGVAAVFLEVRESNVAARALYASLGFTAVGRRRAYYRAPAEDAVVMRRSAPGGPRDAVP